MNTNSNIYTVVYASVMVLLVAVVLAFTSQALQGYQKENIANDKRQQILRSVNIQVEASEAKTKYNELIKDAFLVDKDGKKIEGDAFEADVTKEQLPVFVANINGKTKYIVALYGAGLWGPLWGYIALDDDKNTVFGTDFSHKGETPGLGAEISKPEFSQLFVAKQLFKGGEFKSIAIVKPGKAAIGQDYVDGISGGTITCQGVHNMLFNSLSGYVNFLNGKE